MRKTLDAIDIAEVCHAANCALCASIGDRILPPWDQLSLGEQRTVMQGVQAALNDPGISSRESHANWMAAKIRDGWVYGEETNDSKKTHKCLVPYDNLPPEQQAKDALFLNVIKSLSPLT